jgi:3',5'-nucleoside bisphosphate phosphatase
MLTVDLHTHTTLSDGRLSPEQLLEAIAGSGVDFFSITDHDGLRIYREYQALLSPYAHKIITGVEISTFTCGREVHILGYGFPIAPDTLVDVLTDRREARRLRAEKIVAKLDKLGVKIHMSDVECQTNGGMIGRPHIARALVESGEARDIADAFERFIGSNCPAYEPSTSLTAADAIAAIKNCGGVSVLAHPVRNAAEELLGELVEAGLQGVEVYSSSHTAHDAERLLAKARASKLVMTAGTDFHGPTEANPKPGFEVERKDLDDFLKLVR